MTSSDNLNETMRNLLTALDDYNPEETIPVVIKLTYDKVTGIVDGFTMEDTDKPWVEISKDQYNAGIQYRRLKVVDGQLVDNPKITTKELPLVEGKRWFTKKDNMLIIGNERGWDERGNS